MHLLKRLKACKVLSCEITDILEFVAQEPVKENDNASEPVVLLGDNQNPNLRTSGSDSHDLTDQRPVARDAIRGKPAH